MVMTFNEAKSNVALIWENPEATFVADKNTLRAISKYNFVGRIIHYIKDLLYSGAETSKVKDLVGISLQILSFKLEDASAASKKNPETIVGIVRTYCYFQTPSAASGGLSYGYARNRSLTEAVEKIEKIPMFQKIREIQLNVNNIKERCDKLTADLKEKYPQSYRDISAPVN